MSTVSIGLVGLPNVGKSTLFNALVKTAQAEAANFPFCTIEPNTGVVAVPDDKLTELARVAKSGRIVPATVTFIDIAGLVAGAHKGEGLGNAFLSHIRECAAIAQVVRVFADPNVIHVSGAPNPVDDVATIGLELLLADMQSLEKAVQRADSALKGAGASKEAVARATVYHKLAEAVLAERPVRSVDLEPEEEPYRRELQLLTAKQMLYVANVGEEQAGESAEQVLVASHLAEGGLTAETLLPLSAKVEAELASLPAAEQPEYLSMLGLKRSGLDRLIQAAYRLLGLQSFYTAGELEARAWTIAAGTTAEDAAAEIHTDFKKKFVKAEVTAYADFIALGGWSGARTAGKVRLEGRDYVMRPDDVVYYRVSA